MLPQANDAFAYVLDLFAHSGEQLKGGAIPNESIRTQDHILARPRWSNGIDANGGLG